MGIKPFTKFDTVQKSSKLLLEITATELGTDALLVFILISTIF
jgi:hypothetical protein